MNALSRSVYEILFMLGVTANYTGLPQAAYAIQLCVEQPERLLLISKWVYPDVAVHCHTSRNAVERNLRTVGAVIWKANKPLLEKLACRTLDHRPSTAQLLAILVNYVNWQEESDKNVN